LSDELLITADGPVRIVTLNRPDVLNACNEALHRAIAQVWARLAADPDARAVVVTGSGRAFSAGGDFDWMLRTQTDAAYRASIMGEARDIIYGLVRFPLPIVAAVNGPAVGLGVSLAVLCDVVLLAESAYLADPHVSVGLVAGDGGAAAWPLLTSLLRAKEFLLTGDRIPAPLAVEIGLANRVVPDDNLMREAVSLAQRLARQPAQALQATKRALNLHLERAMTGIADFALAAEEQSMGSADHIERVRAMRDRQAAPSTS
jgi:enoyl-CoA hydratase